MTAGPGAAWTAGALLYGDGDVLARLADGLAEPSTRQALERRTGRVGSRALNLVQHEIAGEAVAFLRTDLVSVLTAGWNTYGKLLDAAARTRRPAPAEPVEQVPLAAHDVMLTQRPRIDVLVSDETVLSIQFELAITISVGILDAVVRRGRLVDLSSGPSTVKAAFSVQGTELAAKERPVDLRWVLPLGHGIPLGPPGH